MNWQHDIRHELETCGAIVEPGDSDTLKAGNKVLALVSAGNTERKYTGGTIVIHEDLYQTRKSQVIQRLKSILGLNTHRIHGRQLKILEISRVQAETFVNTHHLMGFGGGKTFLGLFYRDTLVGVAIFAKIRFMKYENPSYYSAELERYCSVGDTTLTGGLDKVIQHYLKVYQPDDLVTTADLNWSDGNVYKQLGFVEVAKTDPLLFAINRQTHVRRLITSPKEKLPGEYLLTNQGNLKLRLLNKTRPGIK